MINTSKYGINVRFRCIACDGRLDHFASRLNFSIPNKGIGELIVKTIFSRQKINSLGYDFSCLLTLRCDRVNGTETTIWSSIHRWWFKYKYGIFYYYIQAFLFMLLRHRLYYGSITSLRILDNLHLYKFK